MQLKLNFKYGIGVTSDSEKVRLYYKIDSDKIHIAESPDGFEFEKVNETLEIEAEDIELLKINNYKKKELISYSDEDKSYLGPRRLPPRMGPGLIVDNYKWGNREIFYFGGEKITLGYFKTPTTVIVKDIKSDFERNVDVDFTLKTSQGIIVIYSTQKENLEIKVVCFDLNDPRKILWETKNSIWEEPHDWKNKNKRCIGSVFFKGRLITYWNVEDLGVYLVIYPVFEDKPVHDKNHFKLEKHIENPILGPHPEHNWENEAVFNPAAFYEDNKVYLLYRAVGHEYISVIGLAQSTDGIHFDKRSDNPVYTGTEWFDTLHKKANKNSVRKFMSGGGYGGCEDPRITKIGNKLYMIYVAFNGWEGPRLAITSILYKNFLKQRYLWEKPVLISPPGYIDKSGCVFPEKVNGKYVIMHRIYPNILIDFVDDLKFDGEKFLKGEFKIEPRPNMWDSRKIGSGAPPIRTDKGWLLIYQAVTDNDDSKYKVGAMLLDLKDPTKVLHRSAQPIIEPTEYYENGLAKFGVVYPCGAVVVDNKLMVYYGGSDSVCCLATADLKEFLHELTTNNGGQVHPIKLD